ncbi:MAG: hypothetical protein JW953_15910 [Anaerolineae bacterium]|nr:hypothetical protein [Anaerolineae bacterium]
MSYWVIYLLVLIIGMIIGAGTLISIHRFGHASKFSKVLENTVLALLAIFLTFMVLEFFFKVFFAQSDNRNFTLASKNWFERYWSLNSWGYRDIEWANADVQGKRRVLVMGDSFTAGHGIKSPEDRFSNILGKKLGDDYIVMNMGEMGFSTKEEIDKVKSFPYKPDILIHQYYINDIRNAAYSRNMKYVGPDLSPWAVFKPLVDHSYALNFIYWRSVLMGPSSWQGSNLDWLERAYNDPEVWWVHQQELLTVYQGAVSEQVKLLVVVFPDLSDVSATRHLSDRVVKFYEERGVPVLNVAELVEGVPREQLVVSNIDSHPNEWLHAQVANELYKMVVQLEAKEP